MRFILIISFLMFFENGFSQIQESVVSDTSIITISVFEGDTSYSLKLPYRKGEWIVFYDLSHKDSAYHIEYFKNNYSSSEWYRNGQKKSEYSRLKPDPSCVNMNEWYSDGKVKLTWRCNSDSSVIYKYYHNGQLAEKSVDIPDSTQNNHYVWHYSIQFYENGQKKYDAYDPNGKRQTVINYFPSGIKCMQNDIWRSERVGPYKEWYKNGVLKIEGNYEVPSETIYHNVIGNKKTGKWTYYDETGKKIKEEFYEENKLVNTITY